MKSIKKYFALLLGVVMFAACEPTEIPEIGAPRNVVSDMTGSYTLTKVTQIDNGAIKKGFPYKTLDVTKFYSGLTVTFNTSVVGGVVIPGSFSIVTGTSGNSISTINSGTWAVDNDKTPQVITLISGNNKAKIDMGNYTLLDNKKMMLKITRKQGTAVVLSYEFEFAKN